MGQGRQSAPHGRIGKLERFGPMVPEAHVQLRSDVARDVSAALGIPARLV